MNAKRPNQRTVAGRCGCNRNASWPPLVSLGNSRTMSVMPSQRWLLLPHRAKQKVYPVLVSLAVASATASWAGTTLDWKGGEGNWENAAMWGGTLPSRTAEARINGTKEKPSQVILAHTNPLVTHLTVADGGNSRASLILDGPSLTASAAMDVGKYTGSDGRLVVKSGHLFVGMFFVSGGGGPGQQGHGGIEIQGGTVVTKRLMLGHSSGSHCTLHIVGSKASGIAVEDYLGIGVYNYLEVEKEPPPSATELIFDIDAEGVTPIFTWGKTEGRVRFPVPDNKGNGLGTCRLVLHLLAAPPSGDILLIGAPNKCIGEFTELPEGAAVRAAFENKTYEWKLTYRGGRSKCDIMLISPRIVAADGRMVPYVTRNKAKVFQFDRAVVESAYRKYYRQVDAQQTPIRGGTLAFPGAEGYGAYAKGGRGGKVLFVTNLSDAGPGSLREAIETKGPRTVIFRVGGLIETKGLIVREPYLTIAGQTAPGDGICIKKNESSGDAFAVLATHDVVIRFLRIRAGNNSGEFRSESFRASDSDNFIVDHCSCSWGTPQTLTTSGSLDRFTVQWCIIAEGSNKQRHAFATGVGGDRSTWHHNLFAHMQSRVPRWGDMTVQCDSGTMSSMTGAMAPAMETCAPSTTSTTICVQAPPPRSVRPRLLPTRKSSCRPRFTLTGTSWSGRPMSAATIGKAWLPRKASLPRDRCKARSHSPPRRCRRNRPQRPLSWSSGTPGRLDPDGTRWTRESFRMRATARARSSMTKGKWAAGRPMPSVNRRWTPRGTAFRTNGRRPAVCRSTIQTGPTPSTPMDTRCWRCT
jgi:hypothetical protein